MARNRTVRRLTEAEHDLWRQVISTVTPSDRAAASERTLFPAGIDRPSRRAVHSTGPVQVPNQTPPPSRTPLPPLVVDAPPGTDRGTDRRTVQRLKRGRLDIDARLDLHGLTIAQAHTRLLEFLRSAQAHGARCVLVVTGKGGGGGRDGTIGKVKAAVPAWLNDPLFRPLVLSAVQAQPGDGGGGALYLLLRKARGQSHDAGAEPRR